VEILEEVHSEGKSCKGTRKWPMFTLWEPQAKQRQQPTCICKQSWFQ